MAERTKILTPEARLSFPDLFEPQAMEAGKPPKYGATLLFPKGADLSDLQKHVDATIAARWPDPAARPKNLHLPFRDGNEKEYDGYKDMVYIRVTSERRPTVYNERVQPIAREEEIPAGCYVKASLTCFAYEHRNDKGAVIKRGVSFGLRGIQKVRNGEPFGAAPASPDDFAPAVESSAADAACSPSEFSETHAK